MSYNITIRNCDTGETEYLHGAESFALALVTGSASDDVYTVHTRIGGSGILEADAGLIFGLGDLHSAITGRDGIAETFAELEEVTGDG